MLGLSASVLAGRTNGSPHLLPGPGQLISQTTSNPKATRICGLKYLPYTGWRASPALGAMQEPIPDLVKVSPKKDKSILPGSTRKSDHIFRWSKKP